MTTQRHILLARPHPFIATIMKKMLEQCGYAPLRLTGLGELGGIAAHQVQGAVISTSITAAEPENYVLEGLRRRVPGVPVAIATLLEFDMTRRRLESTFASVIAGAAFVPVTRATLTRPDFGTENLFVVVRKADLEEPVAKALTSQILSRHFG